MKHATDMQFAVVFNHHSKQWTAFETTELLLRAVTFSNDDPSEALKDLTNHIERMIES